MISDEDLNEAKSSLTTAKYFTEMLLEKEYGEMNVAQGELVHKIGESINDALAKLNT